MKIEYRVLSDIDNFMFSTPNIESYSLGSESCIHKVPAISYIKEFRKGAEEAGKSFVLVLPKVPEKYMTKCLVLLESMKAFNKEYELVINDYGLLYAASKRKLLTQRTRVGRGISRSFGECLWYEYILRSETPKNRETMLQNNMFDDNKKTLLRNFNITGIECNQLNTLENSYNSLSQMGYEVTVHYGYINMAFSRACQTAKYFHKIIPDDCKKMCENPIPITMNKIWTRNISLEAYETGMNNVLHELDPSFVLIGNTLLRKSEKDTELSYIDNLVFDSRFFEPNDIEQIIKEMNYE